jgi:CubicO group peptidase (beta-lactamase class C family)
VPNIVYQIVDRQATLTRVRTPRLRTRAAGKITHAATTLALTLQCAAALACGGGGNGGGTPVEPTVVPITGTAVPQLASFDRVLTDLMKKWGIPGGAIAVVKDGRLVLARGYGYADVVAKDLVAPDALFRIRSPRLHSCDWWSRAGSSSTPGRSHSCRA